MEIAALSPFCATLGNTSMALTRTLDSGSFPRAQTASTTSVWPWQATFDRALSAEDRTSASACPSKAMHAATARSSPAATSSSKALAASLLTFASASARRAAAASTALSSPRLATRARACKAPPRASALLLCRHCSTGRSTLSSLGSGVTSARALTALSLVLTSESSSRAQSEDTALSSPFPATLPSASTADARTSGEGCSRRAPTVKWV
mmetsp:Transcript_89106/g.236744  ORF Transcript_89106/g.236744 Transcript_89106/m.236744 type:complete len:210 (+) Transcript_89106:274-903(+)